MALKNKISEMAELMGVLSPPVLPTFRSPALKNQIIEAEKELGIAFPNELVELLEAANGQNEPGIDPNPAIPCLRFKEGIGIEGVCSPAWLNGVNEIVEITQLLRESYSDFAPYAKEFRCYGPVSYHPMMIGFTWSLNADCLVIDMQPEAGGHVGQVAMVCTQPLRLAVVADSLSSLFDRVTTGFKTERFVFDSAWSSWIETN